MPTVPTRTNTHNADRDALPLVDDVTPASDATHAAAPSPGPLSPKRARTRKPQPSEPKLRRIRVRYASHPDALIAPVLYAVDSNPGSTTTGDQLDDVLAMWDIGSVSVPYSSTALEIENAVLAQFGGHIGRDGPAQRVELCDADIAGRLLARVTLCWHRWCEFGPAGASTLPNPEGIAAAARLPVGVVRTVLARLGLSEQTT